MIFEQIIYHASFESLTVPNNKSLGGVHIRALAVAQLLKSRDDVEVIFAVTDDNGSRVFTDEARRQGFTSEIIKGFSRPRNAVRRRQKLINVIKYCCQLPSSILSCVKLIRQVGPDVVHVNGLMNVVPIIAAKPFRRVRCVHHLIGNHYSDTILFCYSFLSRFADDHIYISPILRRYYTAFIPKQGHLLMEPIPRNIVQRRALREDIPGIRVIGCVANYTPAKNWDLWIDVAKSLAKMRPELRFVCIGKEVKGHEQYFEKLKARSVGLDIQWTGFKSNILEEISKFDVFLLTSDLEGTPLVLLESAAVMTPVVTSVTGGITDMFHKDEVVFVPEQNASMYVESILKLIDKPEGAFEMAKNARRRIESDYRLESHTEKLLNIYYENFK